MRHSSTRYNQPFHPLNPEARIARTLDLLVEPMPGEAMIEFYRLRAREAAEGPKGKGVIGRLLTDDERYAIIEYLKTL
jgi:hypothetical protein